MSDGKNSSRYPYTYAADYIRGLAGMIPGHGTKLSRADAAHMQTKIAEALGIDREKLSIALADKYLQEREELEKINLNQLFPNT